VNGEFRGLQRGKHGMSKDAVIADQRERIFEALVAQVAAHGYAATTVKDVVRIAHVSNWAPKDIFGFTDKERLFLWAYGAIVEHAIAKVKRAYLAQEDWMDKMSSGFAILIEEVLERPDAARLALVEAFAAGPEALHRMDRVTHDFENMVSSTFAASPDRIALPPIISQGIVGGVSRVVRQRLLDDEIRKLPDEAGRLQEWMLSYHSPAASSLSFRKVADPTPLSKQPSSEDPARRRLMQAAAAHATKHSYSTLTADVIARHARLPVATFHERFPAGAEQCFLAAYDFIGADVIACAAAAAKSAHGDWPQRVRTGVYAILWRIAKDRTFARIAFVEVYNAGKAGIAHRTSLMRRFSDLLTAEAPTEQAPTELVAEAIVGAVWQLAHQAVWRDAGGALPRLGEFASYLVLAPLIGGEEALQAVHAPA
jgi:AcrR family transcriptional regulator